jgi:hypothetical protein
MPFTLIFLAQEEVNLSDRQIGVWMLLISVVVVTVMVVGFILFWRWGQRERRRSEERMKARLRPKDPKDSNS